MEKETNWVRREFSFRVAGTTICFVRMYGDCWICSLPGITAEKLAFKVAQAQSIPVSKLNVSIRVKNALKAEGLFTIADVVKYSENDIVKLPNFGKRSLTNLKTALDDIGFSLRDPS